MDKISVDFEHYRHVFDEETLMRYGSPHFGDKEAGDALFEEVRERSERPVDSGRVFLERSQLICANEAFPESALADPLADLEIWDEWRSGARAFPYSGRYSRLGLVNQPGKVASTTSMGSLGEVIAGLVAQSMIARRVLVRAIGHWPDLIHYTDDGRYAFVEAKAYKNERDGPDGLDRIPVNTMRECLVRSLRQLIADPFVRMWYVFTEVEKIVPMELAVRVLELDAPNRVREERATKRMLPGAVIRGLAERAINKAGAQPEVYELQIYGQADGSPVSDSTAKKNKAASLKKIKARVRQYARESCEELLAEAGPEHLVVPARMLIEEEIDRQLKLLKLPEMPVGHRFRAAKDAATTGRLALVRRLADGQCLFMADIQSEGRPGGDDPWRPDWRQMHCPWKTIGGVPLWRCSDVVYCIGPEELAGKAIAESS